MGIHKKMVIGLCINLTIGGKEKLIKLVIKNNWHFILLHCRWVIWNYSHGTFGSRNRMMAGLLKAKYFNYYLKPLDKE